MSRTNPARFAEAVRRGLAIFFGAAGVLALCGAMTVLSPLLALVMAIPSILLGVGIWRYWGVARWAALGACFWLLAGALLAPLAITVPLEYGEFENIALAEGLTWILAGVSALAGYWGLQYLRSPAARAAYARSKWIGVQAEGESPSTVTGSAMTLLMIWGLPGMAIWVEEAKAHRQFTESPTPTSVLPDLALDGLCRYGDSRVQAMVVNRGATSGAQRFSVVFSGFRVGGGGGGSAVATVPPPGMSGLVMLEQASNPPGAETGIHDVRVTLDAYDQVRESDEANNTAEFRVRFDHDEPLSLPACRKLPEING
jgi:hypothetical protein